MPLILLLGRMRKNQKDRGPGNHTRTEDCQGISHEGAPGASPALLAGVSPAPPSPLEGLKQEAPGWLHLTFVKLRSHEHPIT